MKLIALCGRAQVGKDTTADYLVKNYQFKKLAFADHLKQVAELATWNGQKDTRGRILLQHLGDVLREYDKNIFINQLVGKIKYLDLFFYKPTGIESRLVISDVRLPDEINALKELGASIWYIKRNTDTSVPKHITEQMDESSYKFDFVFDNGGSFKQLYSGVDMAIEQVLNETKTA